MEQELRIDSVLGLYSNNSNVIQITERLLNDQQPNIFVKGLAGSSVGLVAAACINRVDRPFIFILGDKEEAAYFFSDLSSILKPEQLFFFPSSYKRSVQYGQTISEAVIQRTDVLNILQKLHHNPNQKIAIVTYPDALFEKVVTIDNLEKNTLVVKKGEKVSPSFIMDLLEEYGFERVEFVYEPGQYSIRGSIVDIFSYSAADPYRVDFFGDEVESIRTFDVEDQLSREHLDEITLIPNMQTGGGDLSRSLLTLLLPDTTSIWTKNCEVAIGKMNELFEIALGIEGKSEQQTTNDFADGKELFNYLKTKGMVEFGLKHFFRPDLTINFECSPQPPFHKNFELIAQNIEENSDKGYKTYILADNKIQIERLSGIFQSMDKQISFTPIPTTIHEGFIDNDLKICIYTDHQLFDRFHKYTLKHEFNRKDALSIQELINLKPGDYVVHIDHGIGVFGGLVKTDVNGKKQEAVRLIYQDNDTLLVNIHNLHRISKYRGKDSEAPKVYKLGSGAWQKLKQNTKKKIKDIAKDLIELYAKRKAEQGFAFSPDTYMQQELEASFIFEDTPDQEKSTIAVKEDMESMVPMDRLICGDVGFGKTEIAVRAAFKAVADSKQVAILVPTTILALQHHQTFTSRLKDFPCTVDFISRMKSTKAQKETIQKVGEGKIDIIIGTHALIKDSIKFKDLGLLIVDEEQKFGVSAKEKLKQLRVNVDTLTLTATPIPRTLQFSLMGARDLSIINTPPPNRHPISTEIHVFSTQIIKEAIEYEVSRGGQVFFLHNRVQNIVEVQTMIHKISPHVRTIVAHGQMEPSKLEKTMLDFISGDYDVLISTSIIEAGLDIPNANTIIINNAQSFGLSDLHQLRGRVGRSNKKAFCYLITPPLESLTNEARRRLKAIEEFSDLGSGFSIAMQDLDIRGAGNLLGGEQSGFIADIGFETYQRILDEAIQELKETDFKGVFESEKDLKEKPWKPAHADCHIETDLELLIPDSYINSIPERMKLYKELDSIERPEDLKRFEAQLIDRFGALPSQVIELLNVVRLRWIAIELGIEKVVLKNEMLICYFISNQLSPFYSSETFTKIIGYIQRNQNFLQLKETKEKLSLIVKKVENIDETIKLLEQISN